MVALGRGDDLAFEALLPDVVALDLPGDGKAAKNRPKHPDYPRILAVFNEATCPPSP
ncbi:hypothetical protein [Streptomyces sp. ALB3]|uniref:hypothetical protein n=1 Tax=Streptomyces sp. ALB3 TaxID=3374278 RepID=UPI00379EC664